MVAWKVMRIAAVFTTHEYSPRAAQAATQVVADSPQLVRERSWLFCFR